MFIITGKVGEHTYYFQLAGGVPTLNGLKDNAVVYPSFAAAMEDVRVYRDNFPRVELNPYTRVR